MFSRREFSTLPLVAGIGAFPVQAAPTNASSDITSRTAERLRDVAGVPALTFAYLRNGRITDSAVLGFTRAGGPMATTRTRFDAASLTKPVFATAILALAAQGAIDLDRTLQSYVPLFRDPNAQLITARHVLSHSSGLPNWNFNDKELKTDFKPGMKWSYSGEAHFWLLRVMEHLTGLSLAQMVDRHVFRPANMTNSAIIWDPASAADIAWPHDMFGDALDDPMLTQNLATRRQHYAAKIGKPMDLWTTQDMLDACVADQQKPLPANAYPNPAYGMWTTGQDYVRFLDYAARDTRRHGPMVRMRGDLGWGLGWGLELGRNGPFAWQWGDTSGVKNFFMMHLPSRSGLAVFTNGDAGARVYQRLVRHFFRREFDAFLWV